MTTAERLTLALSVSTPPVAGVLKFFAFGHLREGELRDRSESFAKLAIEVAHGPSNAETVTALRKLLEGKDCAVRALLP
jgi:hypothetical protein